ncbi:hypothetical protein ABT404_16945 [Streptomyces hyaluromycini]|uniref:Large membrane protein n=1 Tax=Streptomyces hyaluromycini TaxID=1377993 RepID=A0ABV1WWL2_9ACTN
MKSERPENDDDAAAGGTGEPPEARQATESPKAAAAAEADAQAGAESAEGAVTEVPEPDEAPAAGAAAEPGVIPEPEEAHEPDVAPAADAAPEPEESPAEPDVAELSQAADAPDAPHAPESPESPEAETETGSGTGTGTKAEAEADEEAEAGHPVPRRRSPALVIASVAAAVLLVGGGGAYLAASTGSGAGSGSGGGTAAGTSGGSTPPPLALDGYSSGGNGIAPGEPDPYGVTYKASGTLPAGPGSATVYQPSGEVSKDRVAALAKALGVEGTPVAEGQVWKVGTDNDGSGGSLQVNRAAPGIWTYSRYAPGTDNCKRGLVCTQDPVAPAGDPVSAGDAEKAAAPVLKALGQDTAKLDASQVMGAQRVVNADPVVGGLPTYGWTTGLTVSKQGEVVGGNGMLATPAKGDTYPVLSAAKTLALMNAAPGSDHRMGVGGCASPVPLKDRLEKPCAASTPPASSAVIEKAVFGLAAQSVAGRQALVPSWLFQVRGAADAYTVTYPAVDPEYLASAASPTPSASASTSAGSTKDVKVDGYTADGRDLTVAFTGGVCADYKATADESSEQVVVKVTATPWPDKICVMIAKQYHQTVRLDAPLDGRTVVGTDGKAVPKEKATTLNPQVG